MLGVSGGAVRRGSEEGRECSLKQSPSRNGVTGLVAASDKAGIGNDPCDLQTTYALYIFRTTDCPG